jgi:hypothetical protein
LNIFFSSSSLFFVCDWCFSKSTRVIIVVVCQTIVFLFFFRLLFDISLRL